MFSPSYDHIPVGLGGDGSIPYHTGNHGLGTYGNAAGTEDITNTHVINVFAKKLQLLKVDQSLNLITRSSAEFTLYRKATSDEIDDSDIEKVTLPGVNGSCVAVQTMTTAGGTVTTDALELLANNEPYYLMETKSPIGYYSLSDVFKLTVDLEGHNTWTKKSDNSTSQTKPNPYVLSDWLQEATIKVTALDGTESGYAILDADHFTYDHNNDTTDASVAYKVINNSGYELPSTGGSGSRLFTLLGTMLTALAAGGMVWMRKRREMFQ